MKNLILLLFLVSCSSTKHWTEDEIQLYADGFFHGCSYVEGQKELNLTGLANCAKKKVQLIDYYRRVRVKR
jgi:hypothetical protein